ncbi:hypothetical protein [Actinoplanes aureus]|uniref:Uncharacterized protein n=1 Tax=Actinoplanes aureus TaxID=2792083 RepID=A0A931CIE5_9ACTN|nr:hypothetical protein [Actinoplanes aureus]MBG0568222.1 hypothetical protein [Actinoplanes aureus]
MGAMAFDQYAEGADPAAAFESARGQALHEHGHGGYTGSLAEKDDYVIVTQQPMTETEATVLAGDLMDRDDPRIIDKWGPAGAIPVKAETRTVEVPDLPQPGRGVSLQGADLDTVVQICRHRHLLTADETVATAWWTSSVGRGTPPTGSARLTVQRSPAALAVQTQPDGWLFFGWASS